MCCVCLRLLHSRNPLNQNGILSDDGTLRHSPNIVSLALCFRLPAVAGISYKADDYLEAEDTSFELFYLNQLVSFSRCLLLLLDLSSPLFVPFVPLYCFLSLSVLPVLLQLLALLLCLTPLLLATSLLFFLQAKQTSEAIVASANVTTLKKLNFTIVCLRKQQGNEPSKKLKYLSNVSQVPTLAKLWGVIVLQMTQ